MVDPAHAVVVHPDFHRIGHAACLVHVDPAVATFARHRVHADMFSEVFDVLLLLRELVVDIIDIGSDLGDIVFILQAACVGAVRHVQGTCRFACSQVAVLRFDTSLRPVQVHPGSVQVFLVDGDPTVEHHDFVVVRCDVVRVLRDRTGLVFHGRGIVHSRQGHDRIGIAKIRKIDRIAVLVGELLLQVVDLGIHAGNRVDQRQAVVFVVGIRFQQRAEQRARRRVAGQVLVRGQQVLGRRHGFLRLVDRVHEALRRIGPAGFGQLRLRHGLLVLTQRDQLVEVAVRAAQLALQRLVGVVQRRHGAANIGRGRVHPLLGGEVGIDHLAFVGIGHSVCAGPAAEPIVAAFLIPVVAILAPHDGRESGEFALDVIPASRRPSQCLLKSPRIDIARFVGGVHIVAGGSYGRLPQGKFGGDLA